MHHEAERPFGAGVREMRSMKFVLRVQDFLLRLLFCFHSCLIVLLDTI